MKLQGKVSYFRQPSTGDDAYSLENLEKSRGNVMLFFSHFAAVFLSEKHPTYRLQIIGATSVFSPEPHVAD